MGTLTLENKTGFLGFFNRMNEAATSHFSAGEGNTRSETLNDTDRYLGADISGEGRTEGLVHFMDPETR